MALIMTIPGAMAVTYDGETVLLDHEQANVTATPHTLQGSGEIEFVITSKSYSGNVTAASCFDSDHVEVRNPRWYDPQNTSYWNESAGETQYTYSTWNDLPGTQGRANDTYNGKDCIFVENVPVVKEEPYIIRVDYLAPHLPPRATQAEAYPDYVGKFDFIFMPSVYNATTEGFLEAYGNNDIVILDPVINLTDGLLSYYSYDSDTTDDHGSNDGTDDGTTSDVGKISNGRNITGATIHNDNLASNFDGVNDASVNLWIYPYRMHADGIIMRTGNTGSNDAGLDLALQVNGSISWADRGGTVIYSNATLSPNNWYMVTATFNSTSNRTRVYIDGILSASGTSKGSGASVNCLDWGRRCKNDNLPYNFTIDENAIYNRELNATDVWTLWNEGDGKAYPLSATYYMTIESPLASDALSITPGDNVTLNFTFTEDNWNNLSTNLDVLNITIGGYRCSLGNHTAAAYCDGTANACSFYDSESGCDRDAGCTWTAGGSSYDQMFYDGFNSGTDPDTALWDTEEGTDGDEVRLQANAYEGQQAVEMEEGDEGEVRITTDAGIINLTGYEYCNLSIWGFFVSDWEADDTVDIDLYDGSWHTSVYTIQVDSLGHDDDVWRNYLINFTNSTYTFDENFRFRIDQNANVDQEEAELDHINLSCHTPGGASSCTGDADPCSTYGTQSPCENTNCTWNPSATNDEVAHIGGGLWQANCTTSSSCSGSAAAWMNVNYTTDGVNRTDANTGAFDCGGADDCTYVSGNWVIDDGSVCSITSAEDIGSNYLRILDGGMRINSGGSLTCGGIYIHGTEQFHVAENSDGVFIDAG